jgi:hypothetical protein
MATWARCIGLGDSRFGSYIELELAFFFREISWSQPDR